MLDRPRRIRRPVTRLAGESRSVPDMFLRRAETSRDRWAWMRKVDGVWRKTTWGEFEAAALAVATWLIELGLEVGEKVTILGSTRPEWCISDVGGFLAGAITVGAYPTLAPKQLAYLLDHSDTRVLFLEGADELERVAAVRDELPKLERIVVWDTAGLEERIAADETLIAFADVLATAPERKRIRARVDAVDPADTAIIVYTSGTTGPPKGAEITHTNILTLLASQADVLPLDVDDYGMSFLPMAHVAERVLNFYGRIDTGIGTAFASSIPAVLEELGEVKPTLFGSVPRIYEKAYAKIMSEVAKASPTKQRIFRWAERVGREVVRRWQAGEPIPPKLRLQYRIAYRLFGRIREAFGGRVQVSVTGAAPIAYEILEFFWAVGIPIYEVYGMTEATVVTHANRQGAVKLGTVGKPISCVEDRIAEDGEILVKGPTIFKGYYKNPEATAEAIDAEGWLHTGDIGVKDEEGYLRIVDRKKHIIITAGGKNLTPANIEHEIKSQEPLISQVHVHGDRRPYLTALVTIHPSEAIEWALERGLFTDAAAAQAMLTELMSNPLARPEGLDAIMAEVARHPEVVERIVAAVARANANLARVERVRRIYILERELSLEENEVTPTLKIKRKVLEEKFRSLFDELYEQKRGHAVPEPS